MDVYMRVRELCGLLWHRERVPLPCQLNVEAFDWAAAGAHGATVSAIAGSAVVRSWVNSIKR